MLRGRGFLTIWWTVVQSTYAAAVHLIQTNGLVSSLRVCSRPSVPSSASVVQPVSAATASAAATTDHWAWRSCWLMPASTESGMTIPSIPIGHPMMTMRSSVRDSSKRCKRVRCVREPWSETMARVVGRAETSAKISPKPVWNGIGGENQSTAGRRIAGAAVPLKASGRKTVSWNTSVMVGRKIGFIDKAMTVIQRPE